MSSQSIWAAPEAETSTQHPLKDSVNAPAPISISASDLKKSELEVPTLTPRKSSAARPRVSLPARVLADLKGGSEKSVNASANHVELKDTEPAIEIKHAPSPSIIDAPIKTARSKSTNHVSSDDSKVILDGSSVAPKAKISPSRPRMLSKAIGEVSKQAQASRPLVTDAPQPSSGITDSSAETPKPPLSPSNSAKDDQDLAAVPLPHAIISAPPMRTHPVVSKPVSKPVVKGIHTADAPNWALAPPVRPPSPIIGFRR